MLARPWPHDPECAYLLVSGGHQDSARLPGLEVLNEWLHTLEMWGYRSVRTGALNQDMASEFKVAGFAPLQDLLLMSADLTGHVIPAPDRSRVRPVRIWPGPWRTLVGTLLAIDSASFGPVWTLDIASLAEARRATEASRMFVAREEGRPVGFLLAGATGSGGYVQRLAVLPSHRRKGHAGALIAAAHSWMRSRGCSTSVVNTETSNMAAIELYRRLGYEVLPYGLQVLERPLRTGEPG